MLHCSHCISLQNIVHGAMGVCGLHSVFEVDTNLCLSIFSVCVFQPWQKEKTFQAFQISQHIFVWAYFGAKWGIFSFLSPRNSFVVHNSCMLNHSNSFGNIQIPNLPFLHWLEIIQIFLGGFWANFMGIAFLSICVILGVFGVFYVWILYIYGMSYEW